MCVSLLCWWWCSPVAACAGGSPLLLCGAHRQHGQRIHGPAASRRTTHPGTGRGGCNTVVTSSYVQAHTGHQVILASNGSNDKMGKILIQVIDEDIVKPDKQISMTIAPPLV
jgi:hypothetical protein